MSALLDLRSLAVSHKIQKNKTCKPTDSVKEHSPLRLGCTVALHLNLCRQRNNEKYSEEEKDLAVCHSNLLDHYSKLVLLHTLGWLDSKACLLDQLTALITSAVHLNDEISYDLT